MESKKVFFVAHVAPMQDFVRICLKILFFVFIRLSREMSVTPEN